MARYVALLRGINVGKAKRVAMADLRALLEALGLENVRTLLNSGNAVFDAPAEPAAKLAARIQAAIARKLGVESLVVVKSAKDIAAVVAGNKLKATATNPSRLLVGLVTDARALAKLEPLAKTDWKSEIVHVGKDAVYVWCPEGLLESKAGAALLRDLAGTGTTRNWATIEKLDLMLRD